MAAAQERLRGRKLQARRARWRRYHPLCIACEAKGIVREWTQLDHIQALTNGGKDEESNLQGLCDECHLEKTAADLGNAYKRPTGPNGWPI